MPCEQQLEQWQAQAHLNDIVVRHGFLHQPAVAEPPKMFRRVCSDPQLTLRGSNCESPCNFGNSADVVVPIDANVKGQFDMSACPMARASSGGSLTTAADLQGHENAGCQSPKSMDKGSWSFSGSDDTSPNPEKIRDMDRLMVENARLLCENERLKQQGSGSGSGSASNSASEEALEGQCSPSAAYFDAAAGAQLLLMNQQSDSNNFSSGNDSFTMNNCNAFCMPEDYAQGQGQMMGGNQQMIWVMPMVMAPNQNGCMMNGMAWGQSQSSMQGAPGCWGSRNMMSNEWFCPNQPQMVPAHVQRRQQAQNRSKKDTDDVTEVPVHERTTVMLRNLPNNYSRQMIVELLDQEGFHTQYDFVYLPIDFKTHASLGYCFVNLVSPELVQRFWAVFDGFNRWALPSRKECFVTWCGPNQGFEAHVERYRNSPLMHAMVPDEYKPAIFQNGIRMKFPAPNRKPRIPRVRGNQQAA
mmetsp:Transcript_67483/g.141040  ORF Transcript_67483/g.141040 Transcript_67483/m.141040 type:complete len:469 (-) Transcript_67483:198-1604(-)